MLKIINFSKNNLLPILYWRWWFGIILVGSVLWALPSIFLVLLPQSESPLIGPIRHLFVMVLAIITILVFNRKVRKVDFGIEGIDVYRLVAWTTIGLVLIICIQYIAYYLSPQGISGSGKELFKEFGFAQSVWKDFWTLFYIAVSGPIAKEFVFRGLLFRSIRDVLSRIRTLSNGLTAYLPLIAGIIISSLLFVSMHAGIQTPQLFGMFFMSCVFALSYYLSGSLYVPVMIHTINNSYVIYNQIKLYGESALPISTYTSLIIMPFISLIIVYIISKFLKK